MNHNRTNSVSNSTVKYVIQMKYHQKYKDSYRIERLLTNEDDF